MNWKTEVLGLGALAVGAYFVITNLGKITGWLGEQVFKPVNQAINPAGVAIAEANPPTGNVIKDTLSNVEGGVIGAIMTGGNPILAPIANVNNPIGGALLSGAIGIGGALNQATPEETRSVQDFVGTLIGNFERSTGALVSHFFSDPLGTLFPSPSPQAAPLPSQITFTAPSVVVPGTANRSLDAIVIEDPLDPRNFDIAYNQVAGYYGRPGFINEAEWARYGPGFVKAMLAGYTLVPYRSQAGEGTNVYWEDVRFFGS